MRNARGGAILLAATLLGILASPAAAQKTVTLQRIDVTRLPDIDLYLTVTDDRGNSVLGLTEREMTALIDETPQKITSLRSAIQGGEYLAVALLFDRSGSMKKALALTKEAAVSFIRRLSIDDKLAVISFDDKVRTDAPFSSDRAALEAAVQGIGTGLDTALYDAIRTALDLIKSVATKRQAILALGDGKDTKSTLKLDAVLAEAKVQGVPIYALGLGDAVNEDVLRRLAGETGGTFLKATKADELIVLYQKIADQLKNQYLVTLASSFGQDGSWHRLKVQVSDPAGSVISLPREYIASKGPGISRDRIGRFEKKVEEESLLRHAAFGAAFGLLGGLLLLALLKLLRRDASLRFFLAVGTLLLAIFLGGIVAVVLNAVRTGPF